MMTEVTKRRPAIGISCISLNATTLTHLVHPRSDRYPVVAPVFLQDRPEHLVVILVAAAKRAPEHTFLSCAKLFERAVAASVLQQDARFEPVRADRSKQE